MRRRRGHLSFVIRAMPTITRLFVYPVKSCAGIELTEAGLTETGFDLDRAWMVVDAAGRLVTQREHPRMALVQPRIKWQEVILRAPGMLALHLGQNEVEQPARAQVWRDTVDCWDMGGVAAQWFSDFLGQPGLRLVRFDPEVQRLANREWTGDTQAPIQFADGYPLLVLGQASLDAFNQQLAAAGHAAIGIERFRPNVVIGGLSAHDEDHLRELRIASGDVRLRPVKPCTRCPIPGVDPATGTTSPEVPDTLRATRADPRFGGTPTFGMYALITTGIGQRLRVGDAVEAEWDFDDVEPAQPPRVQT
jgi:uncharacterized protein YcbX